ncbi:MULTISPECIES: Rne/Rng family ribonuclease [unclassified Polaribacter]|uniref:Rne/Rng family ribonuclease n=1 Tax=unclassified Polaribacter TaxID=196858 RepID=UPI0011BF19B0|nr:MULTISPECIES: Rne/Rng family ribonuclease [unclassified Polaribacter]TXD51580.1 ribonuclease E/G [Polaribacter sp. IC063]TXD61944.1 ribonuclease E/G [Polaribacter sp. IC066]
MKTELIIRSNSSDIDFALLRDGKLIELNNETTGNKFSVGDIFLAKIGKVLTGLNASFVNVGYPKDGFLHYHDLGAQVNSLNSFIKKVSTGKYKDFTLQNFPVEGDIHKDGSINKVLKTGQNLLVQIVKEPISTKGPRLSSELSIAGRYLVLVPFSNRVSVSQKIEDPKEKERLKRLAKSIRPKGFGVILRTVAEGKKVAELDKDLQNSLERWKTMCKSIPNKNTPTKILSELNRASSILRDVMNETFTNIVTNDETLKVEIKEYLQEIYPEKEKIVKLHKSEVPIFEKYGIERQIKTSFGKTVSMSRGAYLVIEHTEALHVIDVNSGNRSNKAGSQEDTALEVNLISATEVARQLQLRDMGGIIVVDFIDMHKAENRNTLFQHLKEQMSFDRTKHKILPPSKFGLVQITRQRVRPELSIKTTEANPNIDGQVEAPIVLLDKIESDLEKFITNSEQHKSADKRIQLHVHPFIAAYLTKGVNSIRFKWYLKHKKWITIIPRDAYTYLYYRFTSEKE